MNMKHNTNNATIIVDKANAEMIVKISHDITELAASMHSLDSHALVKQINKINDELQYTANYLKQNIVGIPYANGNN